MNEPTKRREIAIKHVVDYDKGSVLITNLTTEEKIAWNFPEYDSANVFHKLAVYGWNKAVSSAKAKSKDSDLSTIWKAVQDKATAVTAGELATRKRSTLIERMIKEIEKNKDRTITEEEIKVLEDTFGA